MSDIKISDAIQYIGVDDKTLDLFESQYVIPNGVSYNSYVILDEKITVMDTVDKRATDEWMKNLEGVLDGRAPDYLVISHMEPDHGANVQNLAEKYPEMKLVSNAKVFTMLNQFFNMDFTNRGIVVKEGDTLELGSHTLQFILAPMVHWPEVMVTYEQSEKILFSADAFGKFGTLDLEEEWVDEARRYYINIVGKYGVQVQNILKKASALDIQMICPLHGPMLDGDIGYYLEKYSTWSSYEPEDKGVLVAYASIHGNTATAAKELAAILENQGAKKVVLCDLTRDDMSQAVADAFRYDKMVLASVTYDGSLLPCMEDFLYHLKVKTYQKRKVAILENGSWAPQSGKFMRTYLEGMKNVDICETVVTIKSAAKPEDIEKMECMAKELLQ